MVQIATVNVQEEMIEKNIKEACNAKLSKEILQLIVEGFTKEEIQEIIGDMEVKVCVEPIDVREAILEIATDEDDRFITEVDFKENYVLVIVNLRGERYRWIYKINNNNSVELICTASSDIFVENDRVVEDRYIDDMEGYYEDIATKLFSGDYSIPENEELLRMLLKLFLKENQKEVSEIMEENAEVFNEMSVVGVKIAPGNHLILEFENGMKLPIAKTVWDEAKSEWLYEQNQN